MNELIPINYSGEEPTVSARDLHAGLEITDRFSRWFERMSAYGFAEGNDFTSVKTSTLVNNGAEREITDYQISVDMAKQICMIQRSEKGRQYRQYFLDLEKAWNTPEQVFARALKMADQTIAKLKDSVKSLSTEVNMKNQIIGELKPKADYYDEILNNPGLVTITQIAKDYGMWSNKRKNRTWAVLLARRIFHQSKSHESTRCDSGSLCGFRICKNHQYRISYCGIYRKLRYT